MMFGVKQFSFRVHIKNVDSAIAKVKKFFSDQGIVASNGDFEGSGFKGLYKVETIDGKPSLYITVLEKPVWISKGTVESECKDFLKEV
jgi:hypothetical protein